MRICHSAAEVTTVRDFAVSAWLSAAILGRFNIETVASHVAAISRGECYGVVCWHVVSRCRTVTFPAAVLIGCSRSLWLICTARSHEGVCLDCGVTGGPVHAACNFLSINTTRRWRPSKCRNIRHNPVRSSAIWWLNVAGAERSRVGVNGAAGGAVLGYVCRQDLCWCEPHSILPHPRIEHVVGKGHLWGPRHELGGVDTLGHTRCAVHVAG